MHTRVYQDHLLIIAIVYSISLCIYICDVFYSVHVWPIEENTGQSGHHRHCPGRARSEFLNCIFTEFESSHNSAVWHFAVERSGNIRSVAGGEFITAVVNQILARRPSPPPPVSQTRFISSSSDFVIHNDSSFGFTAFWRIELATAEMIYLEVAEYGHRILALVCDDLLGPSRSLSFAHVTLRFAAGRGAATDQSARIPLTPPLIVTSSVGGPRSRIEFWAGSSSRAGCLGPLRARAGPAPRPRRPPRGAGPPFLDRVGSPNRIVQGTDVLVFQINGVRDARASALHCPAHRLARLRSGARLQRAAARAGAGPRHFAGAAARRLVGAPPHLPRGPLVRRRRRAHRRAPHGARARARGPPFASASLLGRPEPSGVRLMRRATSGSISPWRAHFVLWLTFALAHTRFGEFGETRRLASLCYCIETVAHA